MAKPRKYLRSYLFSRFGYTVSPMDTGREFARLVAIELSAEGKRRGITHKQLAEAAEMSQGQISYYIAGTKGEMTVGTLLKMARRLKIAPELIVQRAHAVLKEKEKEASDGRI